MKTALRIGILALLTLSCIGCGGKTNVENRSTTVGQELQDLEEARNKGLLTEDEYAKKREQILKRK
ncbi:MAG: SHOCT domain-containing protein [Phycisphaerales bacterium]|nr:SHOCT domain-containing protein [Phycisphaerales bacterium]